MLARKQKLVLVKPVSEAEKSWALGLKNRNVYLDCLRGLAIVAVLINHTNWVTDFRVPANAVFFFLQGTGWVGVDLIFVLSGFLVSGLLFQEYLAAETFSLKRFYIRRAFKIFPSFFALYLWTAVHLILVHQLEARRLLCDLFFMQSYFRPFWPHSWSLSVEEHFYLLLPLAVSYLTTKNKIHELPKWIAFLFVFAISGRAFAGSVFGKEFHIIYTPSVIRFDSLASGVLISYYYFFQREALAAWWKKYHWLLKLGAFTVVALVAPELVKKDDTLTYTFGYSFLFIAFSTLLLFVLLELNHVEVRSKFFLALRSALAWVGKYSYNLYLWHLPWGMLYARYLARRWHLETPTLLLIYVLGTFGAGMLATEIIEKPFLKLRQRIAR